MIRGLELPCNGEHNDQSLADRANQARAVQLGGRMAAGKSLASSGCSRQTVWIYDIREQAPRKLLVSKKHTHTQTAKPGPDKV